jgi:hypothetical protein
MIPSSGPVGMAFAGLSPLEQPMAEETLTGRVRILEQKVAGLETLPGRVAAVELQIVHLRQEMRGEFCRPARNEEVITRLATIREGRRARKKK